jgi:signal transduction histidine kinase
MGMHDQASMKGLRILLVEDSRAEALFIERTLSQAGAQVYRVRRVQSVREAVECLQSAEFDVILLDLGLPDANGFSGLQTLQEQAPRAPIVILTGSSDPATEQEAVELGAQDYLLKDLASVSALSRAMRHAVQRKQIENLKSEFISVVSHELRTPITSIHAALGLIAGGRVGPLSGRTSDLVNIAHKNSERLILLINDILDVEKLDASKMYFDCRPEVLAPIVHHVVEAQQAYADRFKVQLALNIDPVMDLRAFIDSTRLTQALVNLISNAIKFSSPGATVTVELGFTDGKARIAVKDHGAGMPEEFRAHIFSKFSQAETAMDRQRDGTGLGLYITRRIVEHMHGEIDYESSLGRGSTFWVDLPLCDAHAPKDVEIAS